MSRSARITKSPYLYGEEIFVCVRIGLFLIIENNMEKREIHEGVEALHSVSEAALTFARMDNPLGIWNTLSVLLDLENVLDKGRVFGAGRETPEQEEKYKQAVANMDKLRGIIRELLDSQDKNEAMEFMKERGTGAMNQFRISE